MFSTRWVPDPWPMDARNQRVACLIWCLKHSKGLPQLPKDILKRICALIKADFSEPLKAWTCWDYWILKISHSGANTWTLKWNFHTLYGCGEDIENRIGACFKCLKPIGVVKSQWYHCPHIQSYDTFFNLTESELEEWQKKCDFDLPESL